ncbi:Smr/MutS family protein [Mycoplasma sp. Ms02]|uniref:Smr/MutS family protein n=1 Tax=Mycoplasma sp. Ms02 TaxID=353851 RepID=UPI001C8971F6|nr:Smr/MutS family protein [Mycoplasma sp. Ms02]QZE12254.1 Smr/MutS family protein [Mycoplasma sp. Ms02]
MFKSIDLHGLTTEEAQVILINSLFDLKRGRLDVLYVVTGLGSGALKYTVETMAEKNDCQWSVHNNGGSYSIRYNQPASFYRDEPEYEEIDFEDLDEIFENFRIED